MKSLVDQCPIFTWQEQLGWKSSPWREAGEVRAASGGVLQNWVKSITVKCDDRYDQSLTWYLKLPQDVRWPPTRRTSLQPMGSPIQRG